MLARICEDRGVTPRQLKVVPASRRSLVAKSLGVAQQNQARWKVKFVNTKHQVAGETHLSVEVEAVF